MSEYGKCLCIKTIRQHTFSEGNWYDYKFSGYFYYINDNYLNMTANLDDKHFDKHFKTQQNCRQEKLNRLNI